MMTAIKRRATMAKPIIKTDFNAPPPRSAYFKNAALKSEGNVQVGDNRYLMREYEGGGAELVRFDESADKWAVLCFQSTEGAA